MNIIRVSSRTYFYPWISSTKCCFLCVCVSVVDSYIASQSSVKYQRSTLLRYYSQWIREMRYSTYILMKWNGVAYPFSSLRNTFIELKCNLQFGYWPATILWCCMLHHYDWLPCKRNELTIRWNVIGKAILITNALVLFWL